VWYDNYYWKLLRKNQKNQKNQKNEKIPKNQKMRGFSGGSSSCLLPVGFSSCTHQLKLRVVPIYIYIYI
jgi:hypothetical protein